MTQAVVETRLVAHLDPTVNPMVGVNARFGVAFRPEQKCQDCDGILGGPGKDRTCACDGSPCSRLHHRPLEQNVFSLITPCVGLPKSAKTSLVSEPISRIVVHLANFG